MLMKSTNMKNTIQKVFSYILVVTMFSAQIGCGNKILSTPIHRAQFDQNYTYNIHTVQNTEIENIPGENIQNLSDRIHITQNEKTKYLLHSQINSINGESKQAVSTHALNGLAYGALIGGISMAVVFNAVPCLFCDEEGDYQLDFFGNVSTGLILGGILGGITGLGIGALIPQKQKIQITPVISSTSQGISTGANVQVRF